MNFSLNEMEATAKRATRGAGYSWGQAEEAAKATRWLCEKGLDGAGTLATLLSLGYASNPDLHRPKQIEGVWKDEAALCPLSVGPLLSDSVNLLENGPIEIHDLAAPALLLPFASYAARALNCAIAVEIDRIHTITDGVTLSALDMPAAPAQRVMVQRSTEQVLHRDPHTRAVPTQKDWETLLTFAHRTYAPATEESRLLGAGGGLSDND